MHSSLLWLADLRSLGGRRECGSNKTVQCLCCGRHIAEDWREEDEESTLSRKNLRMSFQVTIPSSDLSSPRMGRQEMDCSISNMAASLTVLRGDAETSLRLIIWWAFFFNVARSLCCSEAVLR